MASETVESTRPWGHLTRDEQRDIFQEARRRWDLSMKEAREEGREEGREKGREEGREEGQRAELLRMIELLSGAPPEDAATSRPTDDLRAMVARLAGRNGG